MTALIFEIKRFAVHDGDGIRTTVFVKGCPLRCLWCHNPEGISFQPQMQYLQNKCIGCGACVDACKYGAQLMVDGVHVYDRNKCVVCGACEKVCIGEAMILCGREMTVDEVFQTAMEDKAFYDASGGGVTLSGGECLCHADFCTALLEKLKTAGIHCAVDTSGFVEKDAIDKVAPFTDVFLYDVKHMDPDTHQSLTGQPNHIILENLRYIDRLGKSIEVRIPLIEGANVDVLEEIGSLLSTLNHLVKVRILPYNNILQSKYAAVGMTPHTQGLSVPDAAEVERAQHILKQYGLNVVV